MNTKRFTVFAGVLAFVTAMLLVGDVRAQGSLPEPEDLARRIEGIMTSRGMAEITDAGAFRRALEAIPHGPPPGLAESDRVPEGVRQAPPQQPEVHDRLLDVVERFFRLQAAADPKAYSDWMRSRGCVLPAFDERLLKRSARAWEFHFGKPMPFVVYHEAIFERLFVASLQHANRQVLPVAVTLAERGARVRYLRVDREAISAWRQSLFIHAYDDMLRWIGLSGMSIRRHWRPPVSAKDIAERDGYVDGALVSIGIKGASGIWYPTNLLLYHDPERELWFLDNLQVVNAPDVEAIWTH